MAMIKRLLKNIIRFVFIGLAQYHDRKAAQYYKNRQVFMDYYDAKTLSEIEQLKNALRYVSDSKYIELHKIWADFFRGLAK